MRARRDVALEFVAQAEIDLAEPLEIGPVLVGRRRIIPIIGGRFEGPLLAATVLNGGADWQVVTADGTAVIDTRYTAQTADGHLLYIATQGFRHGPPQVIAQLAAGENVDPDAYSFRLTARIEASDPALDWVNHTIFVATAARYAMTVTYDLYAIR
jgi:hypothetical protein